MTPRLLSLALGCASLLLAFTACDHNNDDQPIPETGFHKVRPRGPVAPTDDPQTTVLPPTNDGLPPEPTPRPRRDVPPPITESGPTTPTAPSGDYPYAVPVKGKPGLVTSPYAPDSGYIDVQGQPPGQQMRDPYTQKIFLVP